MSRPTALPMGPVVKGRAAAGKTCSRAKVMICPMPLLCAVLVDTDAARLVLVVACALRAGGLAISRSTAAPLSRRCCLQMRAFCGQISARDAIHAEPAELRAGL